LKKKNYIGNLKADPLLNMVGQHYPRLGLRDAPSVSRKIFKYIHLMHIIY